MREREKERSVNSRFFPGIAKQRVAYRWKVRNIRRKRNSAIIYRVLPDTASRKLTRFIRLLLVCFICQLSWLYIMTPWNDVKWTTQSICSAECTTGFAFCFDVLMYTCRWFWPRPISISYACDGLSNFKYRKQFLSSCFESSILNFVAKASPFTTRSPANLVREVDIAPRWMFG